MKRVLLIVCICGTLVLLAVVVFRIAIKKEPSLPVSSQAQIQQATSIADSFAQVTTHPLTLHDFNRAVQVRAGTNLDDLSEDERQKLLVCISRFYNCYSSGKFDAFKEFRMHPPFTLSDELVTAVKQIASDKGVDLTSDEALLHFAWAHYNGANKIGQVSEDSIALSITKRSDLGIDLRQPSAGKFPGLGASCWEGSVVYQPTPAELLKKDGSLRVFALEASVRFSPLEAGPATPLRFIAYWDPTREDWLPYALCTVLHVGSYDTIF